MSTCLSASCKWNIFASQFVRYTRIITDQDNFVEELVRLMTELVDLGYPLAGLLSRCRQRVLTTPILFGVARGAAHTQLDAPRPRGLFRVIENRMADVPHG